jgi:uncharacterized membrane protein YkvA (DUF1232 family)
MRSKYHSLKNPVKTNARLFSTGRAGLVNVDRAAGWSSSSGRGAALLADQPDDGVHEVELGEDFDLAVFHLDEDGRAFVAQQVGDALYLACRDPRVPWYAKALAACVVGYALSPIDLIPDAIPVLGQLDDLVVIPVGVLAIRAMIAPAVLAECREQAARLDQAPRNWVAAGIIIAVWLALVAVGVVWAIRFFAK